MIRDHNPVVPLGSSPPLLAIVAACLAVLACQGSVETVSATRERLATVMPLRGRLSAELDSPVEVGLTAEGVLLIRWNVPADAEFVSARVGSDVCKIAALLQEMNVPYASLTTEALVEGVNYQGRVIREIAVRARFQRAALDAVHWRDGCEHPFERADFMVSYPDGRHPLRQ